MTQTNLRRFILLPMLLIGLLIGSSIGSSPKCFAADNVPHIININLNASQYMQMESDIERIAIGSSNVATVLQLPSSSNEFLIVAHAQGSTPLYVWTEGGVLNEYLVNVSPEDIGKAKMIEQAIGFPDVHVRVIDNRVMLTGTVKNQYERNFAVQTARLYIGSGSDSSLSVGSGFDMEMSATSEGVSSLGEAKIETEGQVIDLLKMLKPTQVRFEAQVIAIRPQDTKSLGFQYGTSPMDSPGVFYIGESYGSEPSRTFANNPWRWINDRRTALNVAIQALVTQNRAKVLSRPSITTMSGEEASIQVGGQIPYTTRGDDGYTTSFKDYGVILQLKPVVDPEGRITSAVHAEVSSLSGESVDGQPILDRRRADSVITVYSGSTMVIGGLMDSTERKTVNKFPLLGDIPIIGEFFKYTSKSKDRQEMIILVTPTIVDDTETGQTRMSETMQDWYRQNKNENEQRDTINFNTEEDITVEPTLDAPFKDRDEPKK